MKFFFYISIDFISPLLAYSALRERCDFLFFSGTKRGRYSFIPLDSFNKKEIYSDEKNSFENVKKEYEEMKKNYNFNSLKKSGWHIPYSGGINCLFSYDYAQNFETDIWISSSDEKLLAYISYSDVFLAFDHEKQKCFIAGWCIDEKYFLQFSQKIEKILQKKYSQDEIVRKKLQEKQKTNERSERSEKKIFTHFTNILSKKEYLLSFEKAQQEMVKGNSFQINLSQGFTASSSDDAFDIFCQAVKKNPAPMMGFCEWNSTTKKGEKINKSIISCSPERLFSLDIHNKIFTQPIAGTRPRGESEKKDRFFEHQLKNSEKEISEHSMIVDLLRNDFGKISEFGSVKVADFARLEKYETVMHLVSDIEGFISKNKTAFDVFRAMFPGGTITGTPKRETMKILQDIEKRDRSFYCGSMGYISFLGESDFNILIRTLEYFNGELYGRAGGGLVFGADGESEYEESLSKWKGVEGVFRGR